VTHPRGPLGAVEQARAPALRLLLYYTVLVLVYVGLALAFPWLRDRLLQVPVQLGGTLDLTQPPMPSYAESPVEAGAAAILSMASAMLLVLPVVWVYTFSRQKRGFQQSLAQTLIILPIVVAVVVVLVKHSVALAFSLGGIVGAVAFRHRLEDTKDAVYIFVAIAIGLAVGMQAYSVALAASLFYNMVALGLWATDFARAPAPLAPGIAARRVLLAKGMATDKRTGDYVARLDEHLLQSMTPEQLKALADRALARTEGYRRDGIDVAESRRDVRLLVTMATADRVPAIRAAMEAVLDRDAKAWWYDGELPSSEGGAVIRYRVRCRKRQPPALLVAALQQATAELAGEVSVA
jgi:hypothetical protein